ncbi:SRPBCC family protein [Cylindrospermum sp. FACHB-282]|uniref:SRPBCC family protein n=1 Tax=Cylindrospermum sp. FACHB-282 TaxID=2692794 RepID=UPI00168942E7|nr:SRPBCC family protein [Cylindrospermum sp. FACHB-282]MBD2383937.1 SRPBCC family protein [Cylindrospermum sp. FACHB-282]
MRGWLSKFIHRKRRRFCASLVRTYREISSASPDELWQKVVDLTDVSWHPLLKSTNVPYGLVPKPGLIFQAVTRFWPIPIQIFVERVNPKEMLSIRVLAIPGVEERVTYQVESTVCGTCLSYSVTLRGWLSPLIWSLSRPYADRVARSLVESVEKAPLSGVSGKKKFFNRGHFTGDFGTGD